MTPGVDRAHAGPEDRYHGGEVPVREAIGVGPDARPEAGFDARGAEGPHRRHGRLHHSPHQAPPTGVQRAHHPFGTGQAHRRTVGRQHRQTGIRAARHGGVSLPAALGPGAFHHDDLRAVHLAQPRPLDVGQRTRRAPRPGRGRVGEVTVGTAPAHHGRARRQAGRPRPRHTVPTATVDGATRRGGGMDRGPRPVRTGAT